MGEHGRIDFSGMASGDCSTFSGRYSCLLTEGTECFLLKVNEVFISGETCVDCVNVCFLDPWCRIV